MKTLLTAVVFLAAVALLSSPVIAVDEINYGDYAFDKKGELMEKLQNQSNKLNERITELQKGENPESIINKLKDAKEEIDAALTKVDRSDQESWEKVREVVEHDINNTQNDLYEGGAFAEDYNLDGNDGWWVVK